jgi:hypothetical protein
LDNEQKRIIAIAIKTKVQGTIHGNSFRIIFNKIGAIFKQSNAYCIFIDSHYNVTEIFYNELKVMSSRFIVLWFYLFNL